MLRDDVLGRLPRDPSWNWNRFREVLGRAVVVGIQEVADYYWLHEQDIWDLRDDFPCIAAPWPNFWMEWRRPAIVRIGNEQRSPFASGEWPRFGVLGSLREVKDQASAVELGVELGAQPRWVLSLAYCGEVGVLGETQFPLDADGRFLKIPIGDGEDGKCLQPTTVRGPLLSVDPKEALEVLTVSWAHPVLLALSFCHCKNVTIRNETIVGQRARIRRGDPPIISFHTLEISGLRALLEDARTQTAGNLRGALHLVRGHFKTYAPDRRLFGRYTGTYWWGLHARGDARAGEVRKDYEVMPSSAPPPTE